MITDAALLLSGAVSATGALTGQAVNGAGTVLSTNTVDLAPLPLGGNQPGGTSQGEPLQVAFNVVTAPTVGTSVQFQIVQADDAALSTNMQVINQTDALPIASLPAGTLVSLPLKPNSAPYVPKRYVGARYVNTGAIATASYTATVTKDLQALSSTTFKSGFAIA